MVGFGIRGKVNLNSKGKSKNKNKKIIVVSLVNTSAVLLCCLLYSLLVERRKAE